MLRIPEISRLRLEVVKFKASLEHIMRYSGGREGGELTGLLGGTKDGVKVIQPHSDN